MCGTYKKNLISTISFYVVLIPYGIGDVVLISLTFGYALGIGVAKVAQVFVEEGGKQLVIGRVVPAPGQIKAAHKGHQPSLLLLRVVCVHNDTLLVVSVRAGGELILQIIRQLGAFQFSGSQGAMDLRVFEEVIRLHVVSVHDPLLTDNFARGFL